LVNLRTMTFDNLCNSILERVFHGTMHDVVGSFDLNKIGTGEGNIAYGWGLYFAENPEIAKTYKKGLSHRDFLNKVGEVYDEFTTPEEADEALKNAGLSENQMALVRALQKEDWWGFDYPHQAVNAALKEPQHFEHGEEVDKALENFGNLYEVEITADKENDFLDWDKTLNKQSEKIKKILKVLIEDIKDYEPYQNYMKSLEGDFREYSPKIGRDIYFELSEIYGSLENVSKKMKEHGIKGVKYLDQGSRKAGQGTYNFVIFDPSVIQIVSKNGEFVMSSKKPENVEV